MEGSGLNFERGGELLTGGLFFMERNLVSCSWCADAISFSLAVSLFFSEPGLRRSHYARRTNISLEFRIS